VPGSRHLLEQRLKLVHPLSKKVVVSGCAASRELKEEKSKGEVYGRVVWELEVILGHASLGD
jgi:hypothetical protein